MTNLIVVLFLVIIHFYLIYRHELQVKYISLHHFVSLILYNDNCNDALDTFIIRSYLFLWLKTDRKANLCVYIL